MSDTILSRETAIMGSTVRIQRDGSEDLVGKLAAWGPSQLRLEVPGEDKRRTFTPTSVIVFLVSAPADEAEATAAPEAAEAPAADATPADEPKADAKPAKAEKPAPEAKTTKARGTVVTAEGEVDVLITRTGEGKVTVTMGTKKVQCTYVEAKSGAVTITASGKDGKVAEGTTLRRACRALTKAYGLVPGAIRTAK